VALIPAETRFMRVWIRYSGDMEEQAGRWFSYSAVRLDGVVEAQRRRAKDAQ
jgi:hypothetical protein